MRASTGAFTLIAQPVVDKISPFHTPRARVNSNTSFLLFPLFDPGLRNNVVELWKFHEEWLAPREAEHHLQGPNDTRQNGLLGRKTDSDKEERVARPLTSLTDPSTFAPPPKRVPGTIAPPPPPSRSNATSPGVPPPPYDDSNRYQQQQEEGVEEEPAPPRPWRTDTTGLSTAHLPPPPGRKDGADGRTPVPGQAAAARPPPPSLPPRLPPRTPSASSVARPASPAPPPASSSGGGYLNQNAMNRLGAAGVSVSALGIGKSAPEPPTRSNASSPAPPPRTGAFSPPPPLPTSSSSRGGGGHMSELQNRFAKLGKSATANHQSSNPPPTEGTTTEQKQAALRTASDFHKNPSSVSVSDARSAASTFNNFRQRHGEQVKSGVQSANNFNQKYGITEKAGNYAGKAKSFYNDQVGQKQAATTAGTTTTTAPAPAAAAPSPLSPPPGLVNAIGKKKPPPPPPPKKKPQLAGAPAPPPVPSPRAPGPGDDDDAPPPIPLATKPTF
ncbi:hypothetical protein CSAL01_04636 [Colletotrichum salicis]|uniref:GMP synthase n=1 Tax=Colletotrichum salicis TaxID=1209931 RepID=A0A135V4H5_9PEZI|nr:hypothetical protein CSAL01_04636 [Colletotrichum salicis]